MQRRRMFSFFVSSLLLQGIQPCNSTILSTELREFADTQLLFWSSFDFVFDAALSFFGPIDEIIREAKEYPPREEPVSPESLVTSTTPTVFDNQTLIREARAIFTNFVRGARNDRPDDAVEENHAKESECDTRSDKEDWSGTHHNHSLEVRGGSFLGGRRERQKFEFSLFQDRDGSEEDPDNLPTRYVEMHNGDRAKAMKSLAATLEWRKEHKIDTILARPHPKFDICKEVFPTKFLGRDPEGHVILLQRPAKIDLDLAKRNKIKKEDLLEHYIYLNEYLWQILEGDKPLGTMISILDLSGLNMSILRKREYMSFLKFVVSVMDSHFPQRAHKTLIVNSPKWFNAMYRVVSPLLREATKSRIEIVSRGKKQDDVLKRYLGHKAKSKLPATFWSKPKKSRGKNDEEKEESDVIPESDLDTKIRAHVSLFVGLCGTCCCIYAPFHGTHCMVDDFSCNRLHPGITLVERKCKRFLHKLL